MQYINSFKPFKLVKQGENQSIQIDLSNCKSQRTSGTSAVEVKPEIKTNIKSKKTKEK